MGTRGTGKHSSAPATFGFAPRFLPGSLVPLHPPPPPATPSFLMVASRLLCLSLCHSVPLLPQGACTAAPTQGDGKYSSDSSSTKPNRVLIRGRFLSTLGARLAPKWSTAHKHAAAHGTTPLAMVSATGRGGQGGLTAGRFGKGSSLVGHDAPFAKGREDCKVPPQLRRCTCHPRAPLQRAVGLGAGG